MYRAMESSRPESQRLFFDPLALKCTSGSRRLLSRLGSVPLTRTAVCLFVDTLWPGARLSAAARTRFIDDVIRAQAASSEQLVLLGAGYDCRAFRMPELRGLSVIEVDHGSVQEAKAKRTRDSVVVSQSLSTVEADLASSRFPEDLLAGGYRSGVPTIFVCEGVTQYLSMDAWMAVLRRCGTAAAGSTLIFTYVEQSLLDGSGSYLGSRRILDTFAFSGERWRLGLSPAELPGLLGAHGFLLRQDLSLPECRSKYFGAEEPGNSGFDFYRIAVAERA